MASAVLVAALVSSVVPLRRYNLTASDAVCLDGSPGVYYLSQAPPEGRQRRWIITLSAGGWCYNEASCIARSRTELGTSTLLPSLMTVDGLMSSDCAVSPEVCDANRVVLAYCDGTSFSSNTTVDTASGERLHFRGRVILLETLRALLEIGLRDAEEVMLVGFSAGGTAATLQANYVQDFLNAHVPGLMKYRVVLVSGVFMDVPNFKDEPVWGTEMQNLVAMTNLTGQLDAGCVEAHGWRCVVSSVSLPYIRAPFFVLNAALDMWAKWCIYSAAWPAGWPAAAVSQCPNHGSAPSGFLQGQLDAFRERVSDVVAAREGRGDGAFLHGCVLHISAAEDKRFTEIKVDDVSMADAFADWWQGNASGVIRAVSRADSCDEPDQIWVFVVAAAGLFATIFVVVLVCKWSAIRVAIGDHPSKESPFEKVLDSEPWGGSKCSEP